MSQSSVTPETSTSEAPVPETSVSKTTADEQPLTLRDHLAMERTRLAGERTLLAYARTAILLAGSGLTLLKFNAFGTWDTIFAIGLLLASLVVSLIGVSRFRKVRRRLSA